MTAIATLSGFHEIRDFCIDKAPPGSVAFHAQLYPHPYPSDTKVKAALHAAGRPLRDLIGGEYRDFVDRNISRGVRICRLAVLFGEGEPDYDPGHLGEYQEIFAGVQKLGEEIRIAAYGRQILRLQAACPGSHLVCSYQQSVAKRTPRGSFWSIQVPSEQRPVVDNIAFMHYTSDGTLAGGPLHVPPFHQEIRQYQTFWQGVFDDPHESRPL